MTDNKIKNNSLIRRWSAKLRFLENNLDMASTIKEKTKIARKIGAIESKIAIKKSKILYGDNYLSHVSEFL